MAKRTSIEEWKLPQGRGLRLKGHNYAGKASYFLTMRCVHHEPVFEMPELRAIVEDGWKALPGRFPHVRLDRYIVMPDHMHGILHYVVNGERVLPLWNVIGAYKSLTTNAWLEYVKTHNISWSGNLWQESFHDHVIRDKRELEQKREYIRLNPVRWEQYTNRYL